MRPDISGSSTILYLVIVVKSRKLVRATTEENPNFEKTSLPSPLWDKKLLVSIACKLSGYIIMLCHDAGSPKISIVPATGN